MAKVLLLGLDESMTDQLGRLLLDQKHEVAAEPLPVTASESHPIALKSLLADVVFSSREALSALKRARLAKPLIVVTRLPEENDWLDAIEAGAADYCGAPFEHRQVRWMMDNALSHPQPALA